jgi:predicted enzyme related to lactoylglutathione lyase
MAATGDVTVIYPASSATSATAVYRVLAGGEPYMDEPYYTGFRIGGHELGLDPNLDTSAQAGPLVYWHVDHLDDTIAALTDAGATLTDPVRDVGGGKRIAVLADPAGGRFGVVQS